MKRLFGVLVFSVLVVSWPASAQEVKDALADNKVPPGPFHYVLPTRKQIENYEQYAQRRPDDADVLCKLALLYVRDAQETAVSSRYEKAEQTIEKAFKLDPDHVGALHVRMLILSANHRFRETLELAEATYKKHSKVHQLLTVIGDALLELGEIDRAEAAYRTLKERLPRVYLDSRLSRIAFERGKPAQAVELMKRALTKEMYSGVTNEGRSWYLMRMGELYFEVGNLQLAESRLNEAYKLHPNYPPTLSLLARIKAAQGKYQKAVELYERGVAINGDLGMLCDLGDLFVKIGDSEKAAACHERFVEKASKDPANAHELAEFYCNHDRNLSEALELAKNDVMTRPSSHAYDAYAWALYKNGKYDEAAEAMKQARRWGTKEAELLYHAGLIERKLGRPAQARALLTEALDMNPHFSILHAAKARLALDELANR